MSNLFPDLFKGSAEMVVMEKGGEGTRVRIPEVLAEVGKTGGQRNAFASMSLVIVPYGDLDVGKELLGRSLEHAEAQGLKSDVRVVKILNRRLNQKNFHVRFPFVVRYPFGLLRAVSQVEPLTTNGR
jgi:hypothetical protein